MKTHKKVLLIENNLDQPYGSAEIRRYLNSAMVYVRRAPDEDLPSNLSSYTHLVMSGSRASCLGKDPWIERLLDLVRTAAERGMPILGVCFGHQMLARAFSGIEAVRKTATPEFGWVEIENHQAGQKDHSVLGVLDRKFFSFASHVEEVATLPDGFLLTASNDRCAIQAMRHKTKPFFGVQFHPERNAAEGQNSINNHKKKKTPKEFIFNDGKSEECFRDEVPNLIFSRFLEIES